jgi:C1A family cysteine protease
MSVAVGISTVGLLLVWSTLCTGQTPQVAPLRLHQHEATPGTGFIPPSGDLSHIQAPMADGPQPIVSHFDWRETGKVSPVKNQSTCGSCYAFASVANFESRVLIDGGGLFDFSENNVKECEWYESSCTGGNYWRVASFLAANGTVLESCDPYVAADVVCNTSCPYSKTLLDWRVISYDDIPDVNVLKSYVQNTGPIYTTVYAGNGDPWRSEFASYDGSYTLYYSGSEATNHAVMIVGWDDDLVHAGGQGAWIVKNSWGTSWGGTCGYGTEGGYFTIAYGSAGIGQYSSFLYDWQNCDPDGMVLYYDEGGYVGSVGYGTPTAWGMCKFVPGTDVEVDRIEFWTLDATTDVDVILYDNFSGSTLSDILTAELDNSYSNAGYHSVELSSPVAVTSGDDVYAVVKITDASYTYPLAYDPYGPKESACCYISYTGSVYSEWTGGDLGIRLRVVEESSCSGITETPAIVSAVDVPADDGGWVTLSWKRSIYDSEGATPEVKRYRIWRRRREVLPLTTLVGEGPSIAGPFEHGLSGPAWEQIGMVGATGTCCYEFQVPTHCDSGPSGNCWNRFCVTAHVGSIGVHFDSPVDSGYSVDNLGMLYLASGKKSGPRDKADPGLTSLEVPEPNPGADRFTIRFSLARDDWAEIDVYDIRGRRVASVFRGFVSAGEHHVVWNPDYQKTTRLCPGVYFIRLVTTTTVETTKIMLL